MPHKLLPSGRRGRFWYLRGSDQEGRFEYSTGETNRRGAEAWAQEFFVRRAGRRVPGAGEPVGFASAAQHYKAFKRLSRAEERLVDAVARYFGSTDCRAIVHAQLVAAAIALRPHGKDSTRNRKVIAPAAAVLHYAADQKWCGYQRLPKFKESRKSNREPATEETLRLLMANVEKPRDSKFGRKCDVNVAHKRLLLAMLYELGLRITDLLRIDWRAINLSTGRVVVRIAKTDETASLELSHVVVAMLANLPGRNGRLFPWSNRSGVYKWLRHARKQANVHYTPHLSRHALATAAGDAQIPDGEAAKLGVWRDPRSLHRYQHVRPDAIPGRNAGALVEPAAAKKATR